MLSPGRGLGGREPGLRREVREVRVRLCLCVAITRTCGFSPHPLRFFFGLQFPAVSGAGQAPSRPAVEPWGWGAPPSACALSCLLSVAVCHPVSEAVAGEGTRLPMLWGRG